MIQIREKLNKNANTVYIVPDFYFIFNFKF